LENALRPFLLEDEKLNQPVNFLDIVRAWLGLENGEGKKE